MKKSLLTLTLVAIFAAAWAGDNNGNGEAENVQVTTITGHINDQETNEALVGVKVILEGTNQVAYTDFDGTYTFEDIKPGVYEMSASYISYNKETLGKVEVGSNSSQVNISLKSSN